MAVAPPLIRRLLWPVAGLAAFAFLAAAALHGERRDAMQEFKPGGVLTAFAPRDAREVEVGSGSETWRFRRDGEWHSIDPAKPAAGDATDRIDTALRLLRDSAPLRVLTADEVARMPPGEYALDPRALQVEVRARDGATFRIQFGAPNPLGAARYVKVEGMDGVALLPIHVGAAWQQVIAMPSR